MAEMNNGQSYSLGEINRPDHPMYKGKLIVLIDRHCASACKDFVIPLKSSRRGTLIGERTYGSTGERYIKEFDNGMIMRVGIRLVTFGDGRRFESVGVEPDIAIEPSIAQLRAGDDPVLKQAIALAQKSSDSERQ